MISRDAWVHSYRITLGGRLRMSSVNCAVLVDPAPQANSYVTSITRYLLYFRASTWRTPQTSSSRVCEGSSYAWVRRRTPVPSRKTSITSKRRLLLARSPERPASASGRSPVVTSSKTRARHHSERPASRASTDCRTVQERVPGSAARTGKARSSTVKTGTTGKEPRAYRRSAEMRRTTRRMTFPIRLVLLAATAGATRTWWGRLGAQTRGPLFGGGVP